MVRRTFASALLVAGSLGCGGTSEVRVFDEDGIHIRSFGRKGEGPGEFDRPWRLFQLPGDSILVFDLARELFVFDPEGLFARQSRLQGATGVLPSGALSDGSILVAGDGRVVPSDTAIWLKGDLFREGTDGDSINRVREFDQQYLDPETRSPFSPISRGISGRSIVWYSRADAIALEETDVHGSLIQLVRLGVAPRPLTEAHREGRIASVVAGPVIRTFMEGYAWPETLPPLGEIDVDVSGHVWVSEFAVRGAPEVILAHVFRLDGLYLGAVSLPMGATLQHIGDDFVLTIEEDDLGVQRVRLYDLVKPSG